MANTFSPFGLQPFGAREGASPTCGFTKYPVASSAAGIWCGDTVITSTINGQMQYITCDTAGTGLVKGVFVGCEYYSPTVGRVVWSRYFPGAVQNGGPDATAYVIDDPNQLFIVQGSTTTVLGTSNISANFTVGPSTVYVGQVTTNATGLFPNSSLGGNLTDGHSYLVLLSSVQGSTFTYPFRLVDSYANYAPPGANGTDTSTSAAIWVVAPNNWERKNLTSHST